MYIFENDQELLIKKMMRIGYGLPEPSRITSLTDGLINETYNLDDIWILQFVNPIFGAAVNDDIAALTPILNTNGVTVPELCRTKAGEWSLEGADYGLKSGRWRLMTKLPGKTIHHTQSMDQIRSLTRAMASFHRALLDSHYVFKHSRPGVHDFDRHYQALEKVVESGEYRAHRLYQKTNILFNKIKDLSKHIDYHSVIECETLRIIHGDPKVSNFMMNGDSVVGIVDLDTMARSRISFDVGDAIRSWCNPRREDEEPAYHGEYAREVLGLYCEEMQAMTKEERHSLEASAAFITLELSMRFAKDALCENYFGFNPEIGHGEHSYMRAESMYQLCTQML